MANQNGAKFDRTNAFVAGVVFLVTAVVYGMTVQPTFSFWDCGEFIACSYILGIPHPPGTPLFVLLGRIFSMIPFVEDIAYRINYISVLSSALTAMFSYLLAVRLIGYFFDRDHENPLNRWIAYIGGVAGALFVAWSATNWANSVEAEVYGLALALSVAIVWLTLRFHEERGTKAAARTLVVATYLSVLGIGIHMTVFLVVPVCAIFFILSKEAGRREYIMISLFAIIELLLIILFSNGRGGAGVFMFMSVALGAVLVVMLYKKINWGLLIAFGTIGTLMVSFHMYMIALPIGAAIILALGLMSVFKKLKIQWKTALAVLLVSFMGFSVNFFIPIRSSLNPRIDENNPSRDFRTFVNFLDRKQYGQQSMVDRMFQRRGTWSNQFGRHAHMGFWSYFEEQYSPGGTTFLPFFALGLLGIGMLVYKRPKVGMPVLTLILLASVGLILYMNFADGTQYSEATGDAYLEVRNRDYFFTPAFVFFGIAMGLGVSGIMQLIRNALASSESLQRTAVYASGVLVFLPVVSLANNYHECDRSGNYIPYNYAKNLLDTCVEKDAILFTAGDNDTFPTWCLQEVYDYRKDIRVVNLSLLNTDWYVEQMKNRYDVPISLTEEQILWDPIEINGLKGVRPSEPFNDRPRRRRAYLYPHLYDGQVLRVQDMMMDEIVLENKFKNAIYFSSAPYGNSPLQLRDRVVHVGQMFKLEREIEPGKMDLDRGYDLFMNVYSFESYDSADIYRDENATGVYIGLGMNSVQIFDRLLQVEKDTVRAENLARHMIEVYPEFWESYASLQTILQARGDTTEIREMFVGYNDYMEKLLESNPANLYYMQDLGTAKAELGWIDNDHNLIDAGIDLVKKAFELNPNSNFAFRRLISLLVRENRFDEFNEATMLFAEYPINRSDPIFQQIMRANQQPLGLPGGGP